MNKDEFEGRVILSLPCLPLSFEEFLQSFSIAICVSTMEEVEISVDDVKTYKMLKSKNNTFAGYCFAVAYKGVYFANILGSNQIISFSEKTYHLEETSTIALPMKGEPDFLYVLEINVIHSEKHLQPVCVKKIMRQDFIDPDCLKKQKSLRDFDKNLSVLDVIELCYGIF